MPGYTLIDPRPFRRDNPYTFFVPSEAEIAAIQPGQSAKLIFAADTRDRRYEAERMWVKVTDRDGVAFIGQLDTDPEDIPGLIAGESIAFKAHHIISVIWDDPDQRAAFDRDKPDVGRFFERCIVDNAVIEGRARVQYIYREPSAEKPDAKDPDSGWRIRADVSELSDEEYEDTPFSYVAIGKVLNLDDSILRLLDAPIGSAFFREDDGQFHPTEYEGEPLE